MAYSRMHSSVTAAALASLLWTSLGAAHAADIPAGDERATKTIETEYLGTWYAPFAQPMVVAQDLLIYQNLEGGYFKGERVKGTSRQPCGDWPSILPNGNFSLDVRCTIETDDGSLIFVEYGGIIDMTEAVSEKCGNGEEISGSEVYFRTQPRFRTVSEKYAWLNDIVAVGTMTALKCGENGYVKYDIYAVK